MSLINFFFFVIVLNTVAGTFAFFLCKGLAASAEYFGAVRIVYPMYKTVQIFYIVPICFIYHRFQKTPVGDLFLGNYIMRNIVCVCYVIWIAGIVVLSIYYLKKYKSFVWLKRKNIPFQNERYRNLLKKCYPRFRWKRVTLCTNFLLKSSCVMGAFRHELVLPETEYSKEEIAVILMHEATHIVKHDNLWKKIALVIIIVNWFNPALRWYIQDLDEWADSACDITVCKNFLNGKSKRYYEILLTSRAKGRSMVPPFVSQLNQKDSLRRRIERMKKWTKNGNRVFISFVLTAVFLMGSSVSALAASEEVVDAQDNWYDGSRDIQTEIGADEELEEYVIPADEVDEEKWNNAVVYGDDNPYIDTLVIQKDFDWQVPVDKFARSGAFVKKAGTTIIVSCYVHSTIDHRVGIRRPDGSMLCVNGCGQVTKTFKCEKYGIYYVFVENMGKSVLHAKGYFIR